MASRKPKPISINPRAAHKPEDADDSQHYSEPEYGAEPQLPLEQTLEEALAEDSANGHQEPEDDDNEEESTGTGTDAPTRIKLKWTQPMKDAVIHAIYDYQESAGAMPSILDLYEILKDDVEFDHLDGKLNHKNAPIFSPASLQAGVNAIRKTTAKDIAVEIKLHGSTELAPLPSLARVQTTRTQRVTDTRALGLLIAQREASLKAAKEAASNNVNAGE